MLQLLLEGISGEISRFNKEILICLLESRFVVVVVVLVLWLLYIYIYIIFKFVSSSTIYNNY